MIRKGKSARWIVNFYPYQSCVCKKEQWMKINPLFITWNNLNLLLNKKKYLYSLLCLRREWLKLDDKWESEVRGALIFLFWTSNNSTYALNFTLLYRRQYPAFCVGRWRQSWWSPPKDGGSLCSSWRAPSTSLLQWSTTHRALPGLSYDTNKDEYKSMTVCDKKHVGNTFILATWPRSQGGDKMMVFLV